MSDYLKNLILLRYFTLFENLKLFGAIRTVYFGLILNSNFLAGILLSVYILANVIADVPLGVFSDIYGKKKTLILGAVCSFFGVLLYAFSSALPILILGAILEGVAGACFSGNNDAIIFESVKKEGLDFGAEYGKVMSFFQIAMIIASFSTLLVTFNLRYLVYFSLPFLFANIILSFFVTDVKLEKSEKANFFAQIKSGFAEMKNNPNLLRIGILNSFEFAFAEITYYFRSNFVASLWAIQYVGLSKVISSIMATISFRYGSNFIDKFGTKKVLVFGGFATRFIDIVTTILNNVFSPALMGISSIFYGTTSISKTSLLQHKLTDKNRSTIPSFVSLFGNVLFAISSILFGYLSDNYGVFTTFILFQTGYLLISIGYCFAKEK